MATTVEILTNELQEGFKAIQNDVADPAKVESGIKDLATRQAALIDAEAQKSTDALSSRSRWRR